MHSLRRRRWASPLPQASGRRSGTAAWAVRPRFIRAHTRGQRDHLGLHHQLTMTLGPMGSSGHWSPRPQSSASCPCLASHPGPPTGPSGTGVLSVSSPALPRPSALCTHPHRNTHTRVHTDSHTCQQDGVKPTGDFLGEWLFPLG